MAGKAAAEDIDVWHQHGHRVSAIARARGEAISSRLSTSRGSLPAASSTICSKLGADQWPSAPWPPDFRDLTPTRFPLAFGVGHKGAHVGMTGDSGPVLCEDPLAEGVLLAEPQSSHTRSLEPEIESSDA